MEKELISVIVPVYNTRQYLERCIDSLLQQTYSNMEIILVDDGSTDGSDKLCDRYAVEHACVKVFHKTNGGSSSARNYGIAKAEGEYLGFVDSDDYVDADMYERLYTAMYQYGANAAQVGRDEITPEGEYLPDICIPPKEPERISAKDFMRELLMHRGDCSFCTKLIRKSCMREGIREGEEFFPSGILNEDFHLLVRILPVLGSIVSLPGHSYHVFYRVGSNSRKEDKNHFSRVFGDCVDNADMVTGIVLEQYNDLTEVAFRFGIFQRLEYLLHIPIGEMRRDNEQYSQIVRYMKKNWLHGMKNKYLTKKNKIYHTLFALAPKGIRVLHSKLLRIRGVQ